MATVSCLKIEMDSLLAKGEPQPAVAQWADLVRLRSAPYYDGVADIDQLADAAEEAGLSEAKAMLRIIDWVGDHPDRLLAWTAVASAITNALSLIFA